MSLSRNSLQWPHYHKEKGNKIISFTVHWNLPFKRFSVIKLMELDHFKGRPIIFKSARREKRLSSAMELEAQGETDTLRKNDNKQSILKKKNIFKNVINEMSNIKITNTFQTMYMTITFQTMSSYTSFDLHQSIFSSSISLSRLSISIFFFSCIIKVINRYLFLPFHNQSWLIFF